METAGGGAAEGGNLPNGIRTAPVTNAVAAALPGPNFPKRARSTNANTVSCAPL